MCVGNMKVCHHIGQAGECVGVFALPVWDHRSFLRWLL